MINILIFLITSKNNFLKVEFIKNEHKKTKRKSFEIEFQLIGRCFKIVSLYMIKVGKVDIFEVRENPFCIITSTEE